MTAEKIVKLIEEDLKLRGESLNVLNLERCLVPPVLKDYFSSEEDVEAEELWLVLEEDPSEHVGYSIFYDENMAMFGLGHMEVQGKRICIGLYGAFSEALSAM